MPNLPSHSGCRLSVEKKYQSFATCKPSVTHKKIWLKPLFLFTKVIWKLQGAADSSMTPCSSVLSTKSLTYKHCDIETPLGGGGRGARDEELHLTYRTVNSKCSPANVPLLTIHLYCVNRSCTPPALKMPNLFRGVCKKRWNVITKLRSVWHETGHGGMWCYASEPESDTLILVASKEGNDIKSKNFVNKIRNSFLWLKDPCPGHIHLGLLQRP